MQANYIIAKLNRVLISCLPRKIKIGLTSFLMAFGIIHNAYAVPAQVPLFQLNSVKPIMMLNMSRDHQLFFKVYDDYSNITDDNGGPPDALGIPDRTFNPKYDYYGYFDSYKCYTYNSNRFEPSRTVNFVMVGDQKQYIKSYCNYSGGSNEWSGNFLNWATMTRMDAIRKILYGGYRVPTSDTATETVLERAFLPSDAHSFAKFYDGDDINKLTPFSPPKSNTSDTGITICNTTAGTGYSQSTTAAPLIRVVKGNYSLWASNERWQCRWDAAGNGNNATASGINAKTSAPSSSSSDKLGAGDYNVRVQVCKKDLEETNCQQYKLATWKNKPIGLLQEYGENKLINFGLITGTYGRNKSGGVLRKNVGNMLDEIDKDNYGVFKAAPSTGGIINTLNLLRLYGYSYDTGDAGSYANATTISSTTVPGCGYGLSSFSEGSCSNWGNPQSEIYYESLRYLAGATPSAAYTNTTLPETGYISGLTQATWTKPLSNSNYCAPLNILQFNASSNSYDVGLSATYNNLGDIGLNSSSLDSATNQVADLEGILGTSRFVGMLTNATLGSLPNGNQLCTAKTVDSLSTVSGTCPDSPRLEGGYTMVGLARHARKTGIPVANISMTKTVRTYGVALAPSLPKVEVLVPGTTTQTVIIQPACRNKSTNPETNCAIVDFKIVDQKEKVTLSGYDSTVNGTIGNTGKLYVNWEDSEQGGDYDQDMWGVIDYAVTATKVVVRTQVFAQSTPNSMGFGYVLTGTDKDGFNVQSGINSFSYGTTCTATSGTKCTCRADTSFGACNITDAAARTRVFSVSSSTASFMESPLYYAAKWGGYSSYFADENAKSLDTAIRDRKPTDTYYFATDPRALADSLRAALNDILAGVGAATSVATVSAKVGEGDFVYQAQFNSQNWSGDLQAYAFDNKGILKTTPSLCSSTVIDKATNATLCTGTMPNSSSGRTIYFNKTGALADFNWSNLDISAQQPLFKLGSESTTAEAIKRVDWISGNPTYETTASGGTLRNRGAGSKRNILGDIVNSSPVYVGDRNFKYNNLPDVSAGSYLKFVEDKKKMSKLLVVGSNDGMLHAFDANTFAEKFAFIPNGSLPKLAKLTMPDYGRGSNPHSYTVDGPITYGDAYINGEWRRIVAGTMGAGGKTVFALDVTETASDTKPKLLFEISSADYSSLGYVLGKPTILRMKNGRWAVVFGNGYDSATTTTPISTSRLFIVDLGDPKNKTTILDTGEGTGLSTPAIEVNGNGEAVNAYAGDLNGNLWRFDLQDSDASKWKKSYKLFKAVNAGVEQPITASPTLGINSSKDWKTMVYFGTGKYFDLGDESIGTNTQAFYAIADIGSTVAISSLLKKTMVTTAITARDDSKINPARATQNGWYLLFDNTVGERVTTKPLLLFDKLIFQTLIPSGVECDNGGGSWLMEVPAVGDKYVDKRLLKANEYNPLSVGDPTGVVNSVTGEGSIVSNPSTSDAPPKVVEADFPGAILGRQSWHQVQ